MICVISILEGRFHWEMSGPVIMKIGSRIYSSLQLRGEASITGSCPTQSPLLQLISMKEMVLGIVSWGLKHFKDTVSRRGCGALRFT